MQIYFRPTVLDIAAILERIAGLLGIAEGWGRDAELARAFDVASNTVSAWRRRGTLPVEKVVALARDRGWSLDYVILDRGAASDVGTVGDPPTAYQQSQLQNFRFIDDGGLLDEPIHSGPEGIAAIRRLKRIQQLRAAEDAELQALLTELAGPGPSP